MEAMYSAKNKQAEYGFHLSGGGRPAPRQVNVDDGQVAPGQLAQHAHARLAMVDRLEIIES